MNHLGGAGEGASAPVPYRSAARGIYPPGPARHVCALMPEVG